MPSTVMWRKPCIALTLAYGLGSEDAVQGDVDAQDRRAPPGLAAVVATHGHDQLRPGLWPGLAVHDEAVTLLERLDGRVRLGAEVTVGRDAGTVVAQQVLQRLDRRAPASAGRSLATGPGMSES
jgi:hypothetical protein